MLINPKFETNLVFEKAGSLGLKQRIILNCVWSLSDPECVLEQIQVFIHIFSSAQIWLNDADNFY